MKNLDKRIRKIEAQVAKLGTSGADQRKGARLMEKLAEMKKHNKRRNKNKRSVNDFNNPTNDPRLSNYRGDTSEYL